MQCIFKDIFFEIERDLRKMVAIRLRQEPSKHHARLERRHRPAASSVDGKEIDSPAWTAW